MPTTLAAPASAVFRPATTLDEVIAQLDAVIARSRRDNSRLGYFACLYRSVTVRVRDGIADGRFQDGPRMARLDVMFANRYLAALDAYQNGRPHSRSWKAAFDAATGSSLLILQHLLLGMNAHINLDLGVAAAQTSPGRDLAALEHDFREISRLLGEMLDEVQDKIARVSPWMGVLDWAGDRMDEQICNAGLGGSRDLAWRWAQRFASVEPARLQHEIDALDAMVAALAAPIAKPGGFLRPLLAIVRLREPKDVGKVLDALA